MRVWGIIGWGDFIGLSAARVGGQKQIISRPIPLPTPVAKVSSTPLKLYTVGSVRLSKCYSL